MLWCRPGRLPQNPRLPRIGPERLGHLPVLLLVVRGLGHAFASPRPPWQNFIGLCLEPMAARNTCLGCRLRAIPRLHPTAFLSPAECAIKEQSDRKLMGTCENRTLGVEAGTGKGNDPSWKPSMSTCRSFLDPKGLVAVCCWWWLIALCPGQVALRCYALDWLLKPWTGQG